MNHSLASAILLYGAQTSRTFLCVGSDPSECVNVLLVSGQLWLDFRIILAFVQPQLGNSTQNRPMVEVDIAPKAEGMTIRAGDGGYNGL